MYAEFSTDEEKLAFEIKSEGEIDYHDNHSYSDNELMKVFLLRELPVKRTTGI